MRKLILLRGAQGTGKTTLTNPYRELVVSFDDFRELYAPKVPTLDGDLSLVLSNSAQKKVVRATFDAAEERLRLGTTIIVDTMNLRQKDQKDWVGLAKKYQYEALLVDAQGETTDEELIERNERRGEKRVPVDALLASAALGRERHIHPAIREISPDDLHSEIAGHTDWLDFDRYARVVVIGDVQSCGDALAQAIEREATETAPIAWVFIGDLFDRGPDAAKVFQQVYEGLGHWGDEVFLVEGNHESNMRQVILGTAEKDQFKDARTSREQIHAAGYTDEDILALLDTARPFLRFYRGEKNFFACHGGVRASAVFRDRGLHLLPDYHFINGVSERAETYRRRTTWTHVDKELADKLGAVHQNIQFHGHRNGGFDDTRLPEDAVPGVYNLEQGVEHGGHLAVAVIDRAGEVDVRRYTERETATAAAEPKPKTISEELADHPDIRTKDIGGGITAYNFTRDAFQRGRWDSLSTAARGLFMRGDKVVARGYEKFFNLGEINGYTGEQVLGTFEYPVLVKPKLNGFLMIVASVDGELVYYTKGGPTAYAKAGQEAFERAHMPHVRQSLAGFLAQLGVSLTFEVVLENDPHIVEESAGVYFLDAIVNDVEFRLADDYAMDWIEAYVGAGAGSAAIVAENREELAHWLDVYSLEDTGEGAVFTDAAGRWTKVKSQRYSHLKSMRSPLMRVVTGKSETLGQRFAGEEELLKSSGVWDRLPDYLVETPTGEMALRIPDIAKDAGL